MSIKLIHLKPVQEEENAAAIDELNELLNDGYSVVSTTVLAGYGGGTSSIFLIAHKKDIPVDAFVRDYKGAPIFVELKDTTP